MADTNLHERLQRDGYTPEQPLAVRKVVATAEKGRRYVLQVSNSKESVVYKIDGYIITAGSKCDKMVLIKDSSNWTQIFVELKGKDLHHAIEQLESTLQNKMLAHSANKEKRARIVAASFPSNRGDMTMEKVKIRFKKIYKCDLRGLKSGQPDKI
ncbi:hypothetical protein DW080_21285 [Bacteroides caccae]|jgi:hypothetical protein|uniref:Uncharacterized protein n=1 Tax=Bacteroides caccae TaxID=47678 RepID=A0A415SGX1_9BACE|nr:hypothetical protein [Bacteroides caccae]MCZ2727809.1 hypothetical protein [Bacteroides caccae]RGY10045.1 hypothetical protein DXA51_22695 [Bacteroides caccae]RGY19919.1 hypothetical protein DXA49_22715 [Bacteroides caccae]RHK06441.1 hypothetical protein DW080_21285 [Bacteroides caccae]RHM86141.1 hypothetical protein DWZ35_24665 [Bacteroides caccae]